MNTGSEIDILKIKYSQLMFERLSRTEKINLNRDYLIPDFQRNYVWKKENIENFIDSIKKENKYFGNLVILTEGLKSNVIDGQQRLTTLSIICKVLYLQIKNKQTSSKSNSILLTLNKCIKNDGDLSRITLYDSAIRSSFQKFIENGESDSGTNLITKAITIVRHKFKYENIDDLLDLAKKVLSIEFGLILCRKREYVHSIFEGLNSTGIQLSNTEKIKNLILGHVSGSEAKTEVSRYWRAMEKELISPSLFNRFLRHYWISFHEKVSEKKLYTRIRHYVTAKNSKQAVDFVRDLSKITEDYKKIRDGKSIDGFDIISRSTNGHELLEIQKAISNLGLEQIYPVLLSLYRLAKTNDKYFKNGSLVEHVKKMLSYCLVAKYGKIVPSAYEKVFYSICRSASDAAQGVITYDRFKQQIEGLFEKLCRTTDKSKDKFVKNFSVSYKHDIDKFTSIIFWFVYGVKINDQSYTTEHIFDQASNYETNYVKENLNKNKYNEVYQQVQSLGNLMLLESNLNQNCNGLNVGNKLKIYDKSSLVLNHEIKNYKKLYTKNPIPDLKKRSKDISLLLFNACQDNVSMKQKN